MIESFLADLEARLERLGVRGANLQRVLAEARDHLEQAHREEGDPIARFGDPADFARKVAAELGTVRACRATFATFAALAAAGSAFVLALALVPAAGGWPDLFGGRLAALGPVAGLAMLVLPQVAFVSGSLALIRALRLRGGPAAGREQLALLRRRDSVALVATGLALVALACFALDDSRELAGWWTWSTVGLCTALALPLVAAGRAVAASASVQVAAGGTAGDVFDDLQPVFRLEPLRRLHLARHPWRFALLCAAGAGVAGFALGWYAEGDPASGLVRGGFEAFALVICFAVLGRTLGLRRANG